MITEIPCEELGDTTVMATTQQPVDVHIKRAAIKCLLVMFFAYNTTTVSRMVRVGVVHQLNFGLMTLIFIPRDLYTPTPIT